MSRVVDRYNRAFAPSAILTEGNQIQFSPRPSRRGQTTHQEEVFSSSW